MFDGFCRRYSSDGGVMGIWKRWAIDVYDRALEGGHFFPEENPTAVIAELRTFFARQAVS